MSTFNDFVTTVNSVPNLHSIPEIRNALGVPRKITELCDDNAKKGVKAGKMRIALSKSLAKNQKTLISQIKLMNKNIATLASKESKGSNKKKADKAVKASKIFLDVVMSTDEDSKPGENIKACRTAWKTFQKTSMPDAIKKEVAKSQSKITVLLKQLLALEVQLAKVLPDLRSRVVAQSRCEFEFDKSLKKVADAVKPVVKERSELAGEANQLFKGLKAIKKTIGQNAF